MKNDITSWLRRLAFACTASVCGFAAAQDKQKAGQDQEKSATGTPTIVSDDDRLDGDHLLLRSNVKGFAPRGDTTAPKKCALKASKLSVHTEKDGLVTVTFYYVGKKSDIDDKDDARLWREAEEDCPEADRVNTTTFYTISRAELERSGFRRTGVTFGGLVVPFKYRLGGDRKITASSTVAPYVGWRTALLQGFGVSFTPLFSAGLGLVPITDPTTNETETKTALSLATGLVITSTKNQKFSAGLVVGKDFLSTADKTRDPNADKAWLSFYVGVGF